MVTYFQKVLKEEEGRRSWEQLNEGSRMKLNLGVEWRRTPLQIKPWGIYLQDKNQTLLKRKVMKRSSSVHNRRDEGNVRKINRRLKWFVGDGPWVPEGQVEERAGERGVPTDTPQRSVIIPWTMMSCGGCDEWHCSKPYTMNLSGWTAPPQRWRIETEGSIWRHFFFHFSLGIQFGIFRFIFEWIHFKQH